MLRLGIAISNYKGNFFTRQTDLLALPNFNPKHSFSVELSIEESLSNPVAFIQAALLHTTSSGERRIRVITMALPISLNPSEIMGLADASVIANILAKNAIVLANRSDDDPRDYLFSKSVDILQAVKGLERSSSPISLPKSLKPILFLIHGAIRSLFWSKQGTLFDSTQTPTLEADLRAFMFYRIETMSVTETTKLFSPRIYALHYYDETYGSFWPVPLSGERFERNGAYLLDDGTSTLYLWVGDLVSVELQQAMESIDISTRAGGKVCMSFSYCCHYNFQALISIDKSESIATALGTAICALIKQIDQENGSKSVVVCVSGKPSQGFSAHSRVLVLQRLLEDRTENAVGFSQWLGLLRDKVSPM